MCDKVAMKRLKHDGKVASESSQVSGLKATVGGSVDMYPLREHTVKAVI